MAFISSFRTIRKPNLIRRCNPLFAQCCPMSSSSNAEKAMQAYWAKNKALNRPAAPWQTYKFEHQMSMSLAHRVSGAAVGVVLYAGGIALALAPDSIPVYMEALKSLQLGPALMFPVKFIIVFPVIFHTITGIRHLLWDFRRDYKIPQVKPTGSLYTRYGCRLVHLKNYGFLAVAVALSSLLAGLAYIK